MSQHLYRVFYMTHDPYGPAEAPLVVGREIRIYATGHRQHTWNETVLVGVAMSARAKVATLQDEAHRAGSFLQCDATKYSPKVIGVEGQETSNA